MNSNLLSICIPTYNRKLSIVRLVRDIIEHDILSIVNLIIINDGSTDGTDEELCDLVFPENSTVHIVNQKNKGLARTFVDFFSLCRTDYMFFLADDDMIIKEGIQSLICFISEFEPDFVSTQWLDSDGIKPFRNGGVRKNVSFKEIRWAADHAPGLAYRISAYEKVMPIFKERLNSACYASLIFPQTVLVLILFLYSENLRWFATPVGGFREGGAKTSGLRDKQGNHWSSVAGRWQEHNSFLELYDSLILLSKTDKKRYNFEYLLRHHNLSLYSRIRSGISAERPDILNYFDGGAFFWCLRHARNSVQSFITFVKKKFLEKSISFE